MKMRKLMAVLLAVVVAISAMAISVFADDYEVYPIEISNAKFDTTYGSNTVEYTFSAAVYAKTGYVGVDSVSSINVTVPVNFASYSYKDTLDQTIVYYAELNGAKVQIGSASVTAGDNSYGTYTTITIDVGAWAYDVTDSANAMLPYSGTVSTSGNTLTVYADVTYSGVSGTVLEWATNFKSTGTSGWPYTGDATQNAAVNVCFEYVYDDATSNTIYLSSSTMSCSGTPTSASASQYVVIIPDVDDATAYVASANTTGSNLLIWDHTLLNRAAILNASQTEGAYAELVVTLESAINGYAIYTLNTAMNDSTVEGYSSLEYYLSLSTDQYAVSTCTVTGSTTELVFSNIPLTALYNSDYMVYNAYMTVTENLLLEADAGTAASGTSYKYYTYTDSSTETNQLRATAVTLNICMPAESDDVVDTDEPVEPGDTDSDDDDIDVNDDGDNAEADSNPTTGIVLALVPMAVAAAAAVASKRR